MILTIFGYPKAGKTLLFNLLTGQHEQISKFSTQKIEFHKSIVDVPDERVKVLAEHFQAPAIYARIEYLDTGPVSFGESKSETFIDLLRRADGLVHVARGFLDPEILHPPGPIDPQRDIEAMEDELKTVDFISVDKRIERLKKDAVKIKSKELTEELDLMNKLKDWLEAGKPLRDLAVDPQENTLMKGFKFLSQKPLINVINADENTYMKHLALKKEQDGCTSTLVFCGKIETELLELDEGDREIFAEEYGLKQYEYMKETFIKQSYRLMNLISFFTVGKDEVKAWTVQNNETAYTAAGKIHTDIQEGFIRGETIQWNDFLSSGSFAEASKKGLLRLEGKDYVVKDGDIIHFRFNK